LERVGGSKICGEADNGVDAVKKALSLSPDLLIIDFRLPRLNGLQVARQLRAKMLRTAIILFTLDAEDICSQDAESAGIDAVVSKMDADGLQQHTESLLAVLKPA
jgi:DNA-binding NarL/FixJ family response regulator